MRNSKSLFLASSSPRRKMLMQNYNLEFEIVKSSFQETALIVPYSVVEHQYLAEQKSKNAILNGKQGIVIGADTVGVLGDKILEKPVNEQDAYNMLSLLSGNKHDVITVVSLYDTESNINMNFYEKTRVYFKKLSDEMILNYISTGEPMDKAAAYAIQGLGAQFIDRIDGDYDNVVGLPMKSLLYKLEQMNAIKSRKEELGF